MFDIRALLAEYSKTHREPFNEELFLRSEYDIIEYLKKVILSITNNEEYDNIMSLLPHPKFSPNEKEKNYKFVIKVNYFNVIEDYVKVKDILHELESEANRANKRITYNIHDYINLQDNNVILLEVNYHVEVGKEQRDASVYIDIPKVVNKYYNHISGTDYFTYYQVADSSTYNNAQNKKRDPNTAFRQVFQKYNIYKKTVQLNAFKFDPSGELVSEPISCTNFTVDLFGNNISLNKYFLAVYGLFGAMRYLMLTNINFSNNAPEFECSESLAFNKEGIWITVHEYIWNNSEVVQSFVYTVLNNIPKKPLSIEQFMDNGYWLEMLGADFKNKSIQKGYSMMDSVMRNYDINMKEELRLPEDDKKNLLDIFRWEMYEFDALYVKDNYDMTYKKLRIASYIAGFYASKLSYNLISISKNLSTLTVDKLLKNLNIHHSYILKKMKTEGTLVSYKNNVNDDDGIFSLKFTVKGESGIGENKASAVPLKYKLANPSHIGKLDCDTSAAGDPGMTGLICPYMELGKGNYMAEYEEPCNWREVQAQMIDDYRHIVSMKSVFQTKQEIESTPEGQKMLGQLEQISGIIDRLMDFTVRTDPFV